MILLKKRILLPVLALLVIGASLWLAFVRSDPAQVIVYNLTGAPIPGLRVTACGQTRSFGSLADEDSVSWRLVPSGTASEIELETATEPAWRWQGDYLEPHGGYRATVRLWPDGVVESHVQRSIWRRGVGSAAGP